MTIIFNIFKIIIIILAKFCSIFWSSKVSFFLYTLKRIFVSEIKKNDFLFFGKGSLLGLNMTVINSKFISIGNNTSIGNRASIGCFLIKPNFEPQLSIGDNVSIGEDCHITCANSISIGNNVLTGKKVLISDNSHGTSSLIDLSISPIDRPIVSKGPIIIEENVWIGEKATILSGVRIGKGSIVGANAVVTKDVPEYSVVVGNPAKIIIIKGKK